MTSELSYLWMTAGFGVLAAVGLLFARWPGWVGFPLSILAIRFGVDAGIAPIMRYGFGLGELLVEDVTIVRPPAIDEIGAAVAMLALGYGCIGLGMLAARVFAGRIGPQRAHPQQMSAETARRGFRASTLVFLFGSVINVFAVMVAGSGLEDLGEIAATRAAYTNEAAYSSAWFNYAWVLRSSMQIGALAMLLFAYRLRRRIGLAWVANLAYFAVQAIFGGRTTIVVGGLVLAITYHHGIRKLRARNLLLVVAAVLSALAYIAIERHKAEGFGQAIVMSVLQLGSSRAMEEVAFAQREFPERVPYFYGSTIASGLSMALPGLDVGQNLWRTIEDEFLGPGYRTARGIGGQTISTTGENYMNFGTAGVIGVGLLAGLIFGSVYEWQRRNPTNPFALLLAALVTTVFIVAIYKKMPIRMSDIPMRMLVPLGFIAAYAAGGRYLRTWATLAGVVLVGLLLFRLSLADPVKYLALFFIVVTYVYSVAVQTGFARIDARRQPRPAREAEPPAEPAEAEEGEDADGAFTPRFPRPRPNGGRATP